MPGTARIRSARSEPDPARATLTKAVLRAAALLGVSQAALGAVLGVSAATVSRMGAASYLLDPTRKEWELATLFVRLFRSLDSIAGSRDDASRAWLGSPNHSLGAAPLDLIRSAEGLVRVVHYLDAARGR